MFSPTSSSVQRGTVSLTMVTSSVCVCFQWEMFSVPELENFLAILTREEADHMDRLRTRYFRLRVHLLNRVRDLLGHWTRFWVCLCLCVCVCVCVCVSWPGSHTHFLQKIFLDFPWPGKFTFHDRVTSHNSAPCFYFYIITSIRNIKFYQLQVVL